jgi:hypothetical protein
VPAAKTRRSNPTSAHRAGSKAEARLKRVLGTDKVRIEQSDLHAQVARLLDTYAEAGLGNLRLECGTVQPSRRLYNTEQRTLKSRHPDVGPSLSGSRTETNENRARVGCILIGMKK